MNTRYKFIDLSYINEISGDSIAIKRELIEIFLDQIPEFESNFKEHFESKNWKLLAQVAHKAKSSVLSMGLESLGKVDLKNLELFAQVVMKINLEKKISLSEKEILDLQIIESNLGGYPKEKMKWIMENASEKKIQELIKKFTDICKNVTLELNCELNSQVF